MGYLKVYTREPIENIYPNSLANSVHFAYSKDGGEFEALNQNYGILFSEAEIRENNTIAERGIKNPVLCRKENGYLVQAEYVDADGNQIDGRKLVQWYTEDFITFLKPEITTEKIAGEQVLEIPDEAWNAISERWMPVHSVGVSFPQDIKLNTVEEIDTIKATVVYSDGSTDAKKVDWDRESLTEIGANRYKIHGKIAPVQARFPLAVGYADPVVFHWENSWYFLATNDNVNDVGLFVRKADCVDGLFAEDVKEYCILDYNKEKGFVQTFWAPEFHVIDGNLYILFAVSGVEWGPQCHMMRLKQGGEIIEPSHWEEPVRVCKMDGKPLAQDSITLDMTYFKADQKAYLVWSQRYHIGTPADSGSMLYIAEADEKKPWVLASEPVLLSRPLYGWENNSGTINNEGPYALVTDDKIYLAYSGGDACGYYYVVGFLVAGREDNLLDNRNWSKQPTAAFSSASIEGIQGPGHNSFYRDEEGRLMIAYHAQEREKYFKRCTAIHRVHISRSGIPLLNVAGERDVAKELEEVEIEFMVGEMG